jgi:hypothetical protein
MGPETAIKSDTSEQDQPGERGGRLVERLLSSNLVATDMARSENEVDTAFIKLSTTPAVCRELDELVKTGLFGKSRAEVAEQLLRERLREVIHLGWTTRSTGKEPRA